MTSNPPPGRTSSTPSSYPARTRDEGITTDAAQRGPAASGSPAQRAPAPERNTGHTKVDLNHEGTKSTIKRGRSENVLSFFVFSSRPSCLRGSILHPLLQ